MTLNPRQFQELPGIEMGPVSHPDDPEAPEWLNNRMAASSMDHAFSQIRRQRLLGQLGATEWNMRDRGMGGVNGPKESPLPEGITHVYRGMHTDEFEQARKRGYIQSDERGVIIPGWEGTNASVDPGSAMSYMPRRPGGGRIVKIAVHPEDKWFQTNMDPYARTRSQIPWSRVVSHTEHFIHGAAEDAPETFREGVKRTEKID